MYFQVPERVGVNGAGEGHWAPSSSNVSHPAYHQASLLWNSLLPCTVGHIKKRDQRTEPERERDGEGGQEGLGVTKETLQALPSKSHQLREDEEERKTERKTDLRKEGEEEKGEQGKKDKRKRGTDRCPG